MSISNTAVRIIVSAIAIPAIVVVSYLGNYYFFIFILAIAIISFYEFSLFAKNKEIEANVILGILSVILIIANSFRNFIDFYALLILVVLILTIVELFRNKGSAIVNLGTTLTGIFYIGLFASALVSIREYYPAEYTRGGLLILSILFSIWICDSAAFFGGTSLGKHKMFPRVSPKKSWEGAVFGLLFAVAAMISSKAVFLDFISWKDAILLGLIIGIVGQVGDLVESLFKRDAGVKDSSGFIPGHGGVFDRFDSLLYVAPVVFLYIKYFS
ncbi:MAG: phosphatidate cytidylyltransferase [Ignavibacterium sp.]|nr:MAG: phosphatidate cytidylyltransferase [Ignavibacterium sp.]